MTNKIKFGSVTIPYTVLKTKRRKTSQISVDKNNVVVRTLVTKSHVEIKKMVQQKAQWIFEKQQEFKKLKTPNKTKLKTHQFIEKRTWKLASEFGFLPTKVVVKKLKSRWGSAGKTGTITINEELTKTPPRLIDYIIIHELCHLKIQDHSYRYWNLVRKYCPEYEKRKLELDNLGLL